MNELLIGNNNHFASDLLELELQATELPKVVESYSSRAQELQVLLTKPFL